MTYALTLEFYYLKIPERSCLGGEKVFYGYSFGGSQSKIIIDEVVQ